MTLNLADIYLNQTGTLYSRGAAGIDGEPTYSEGSSVSTRVVPLSEFTRAQTANTNRATAKAFFSPATTVAVGDRLTVESAVYTVVGLDSQLDINGRVVIQIAQVATA